MDGDLVNTCIMPEMLATSSDLQDRKATMTKTAKKALTKTKVCHLPFEFGYQVVRSTSSSRQGARFA